jgi:hypothetical protein
MHVEYRRANQVYEDVHGGMGWMEDGNLFPGLRKESNSQNPIESCILGSRV